MRTVFGAKHGGDRFPRVRTSHSDAVQREIAAVKADLLRYKQRGSESSKEAAAKAAEANREFLSPLELQRLKYVNNRRRAERKDREVEVRGLSRMKRGRLGLAR